MSFIPYLNILPNIMSSFYVSTSSIGELIDSDGVLKHMKWKVSVSHSVVSNSLWPHAL